MVCSEKPHALLLVFTCFWYVWWNTCIIVKAANHSLKQGEKLNATSELCSQKGIYCMSFQPALPHQNFTYLFIYAKGKDNWVVWTANKNQPVDPDSAVLLLDHTGVLKIESKPGKPIILYSTTQPENNSYVATLLDTGNFVLEQLHPNGSVRSMLWQSFDTPDDSLLPTMKLGVDLKTGHNRSVVSWLSSRDPSPGAFRLEWDPSRRELIIRRRGQICWSSGELRNNIFKHISGETHFKVVSNENEDYFTLEASNGGLTKWTLLETGQLINREGNDIARADMCYGYNTDGGCQKWEDSPSCRNPGDVFEPKVGYPNLNIVSYEENSSYGPSDCMAICWRNCSCVGFKEFNDDGTGCTFFLWNSTEGTNFADGGEKFYILVKKDHHKSIKMWIWICVAIAIVLLMVCASILCLVLNKRNYMPFKENKRIGKETQMQDSARSSANKDLDDDLKKGHGLMVFNYTSIVEATNGFASVNKLGQGGFGPVYKGILPKGQKVAVKRLSKTSGQGIVEFKNELSLICELQHTNLVQLLGFCIHEEGGC